MELSTIEHVLLARAALATGNPDALEALVRAALSANAPVRERARAVLLAEASARGITPSAPDGGPEDAPATFDDYRARVARLAAGDGGTAEDGMPRWLVAATRLARRRAVTPGVATGAERERS